MKLFPLPLAVCVAGLLAWPAAAQTLGQGGGAEIHWWRVLGALIVCIGLAFGAAFALRERLQLGPVANLFGAAPKLFGAPPPRRLTLLESLRLTPQVHVCLVRCDNQEFLLAVSPGGVVSVVNGPLRSAPDAAP